MATTVQRTFSLDSVNRANANAYWGVVTSTTNFNGGGVVFVDASTGIADYFIFAPKNIAATPAWNVSLYHFASTAATGNVVLSCFARIVDSGIIYDSAMTTLFTTSSFAVATTGGMLIQTLSASNFDGSAAITAGSLIQFRVLRDAAHGSDTINAGWVLKAPILICDVTT